MGVGLAEGAGEVGGEPPQVDVGHRLADRFVQLDQGVLGRAQTQPRQVEVPEHVLGRRIEGGQLVPGPHERFLVTASKERPQRRPGSHRDQAPLLGALPEPAGDVVAPEQAQRADRLREHGAALIGLAVAHERLDVLCQVEPVLGG